MATKPTTSTGNCCEVEVKPLENMNKDRRKKTEEKKNEQGQKKITFSREGSWLWCHRVCLVKFVLSVSTQISKGFTSTPQHFLVKVVGFVAIVFVW